jgi:hypothetical protein
VVPELPDTCARHRKRSQRARRRSVPAANGSQRQPRSLVREQPAGHVREAGQDGWPHQVPHPDHGVCLPFRDLNLARQRPVNQRQRGLCLNANHVGICHARPRKCPALLPFGDKIAFPALQVPCPLLDSLWRRRRCCGSPVAVLPGACPRTSTLLRGELPRGCPSHQRERLA